ncbi:MAG: helicase-related protein, partial [Thermoplasmatota archaeon]
LASFGEPAEKSKRLDEGTRDKCRELLAQSSFMTVDSKFDVLVEALTGLAAKGVNRVIIFSQWRPTVAYLASRLSASGWRTWALDSDSNFETRIRAVAQFSRGEGPAAIVCTDVLSEGLDLVAAQAVVNYDMPFNPQRLEQRVGRIDRIGQASPVVHVVNVVMRGTVDERTHDLLVKRLRVFDETLGGMEEVLEAALSTQDADLQTAEAAVRKARDASLLASSLLVVPEQAFSVNTGSNAGEVRGLFLKSIERARTALAQALGLPQGSEEPLEALFAALADSGEVVAFQADIAATSGDAQAQCELLARPTSRSARAICEVLGRLLKPAGRLSVSSDGSLATGMWTLREARFTGNCRHSVTWELAGATEKFAVEADRLVAALTGNWALLRKRPMQEWTRGESAVDRRQMTWILTRRIAETLSRLNSLSPGEDRAPLLAQVAALRDEEQRLAALHPVISHGENLLQFEVTA